MSTNFEGNSDLFECTLKVSSAEEDVNIQVDKMAHSVDVSQPLPPAIPVLLQWSHEDSDHGSRDAH